MELLMQYIDIHHLEQQMFWIKCDESMMKSTITLHGIYYACTVVFNVFSLRRKNTAYKRVNVSRYAGNFTD